MGNVLYGRGVVESSVVIWRLDCTTKNKGILSPYSLFVALEVVGAMVILFVGEYHLLLEEAKFSCGIT